VARELLPSVLGIVFFGILLGFVVNQISPRGISLLGAPKQAAAAGEFISLERAREFWDNGAALFLDARAPADYAAGHIGNALNLPALSFESHFGAVAPMLAPESPLVLYCDGTECDLSHRLAASLRQLGFTNSHVLFNGWTAWRQAGWPVSSNEHPQ
jgi:rhodanese-related sulfurtransferase